MSIRAKTRHRLIILFVVMVTLIAGSAGAWVWRKHAQKQFIAERRVEAMQAFDNKDYATYVDIMALDYFVSGNNKSDDVEANLKFAVARQHVELEKGVHIYQAYSAYQRVLIKDPVNLEALKGIATLATESDYSVYLRSEPSKLRDYALKLLELENDSLLGLRTLAIAYTTLKDQKLALETSEKMLERNINEIKWLLFHDALLGLNNRKSEERLVFALQLAEKHPGPLHQLYVAYVCAITKKKPEALEWLNKAAKNLPDNEDTIIRIVQLYEGLREYIEPMNVLAKSLEIMADSSKLRTEYAERLWQRRKYDEAEEVLKDVKPGKDVPTELLAIKCMTLNKLNREKEIQPYIDELQKRKNDNKAKAWDILLTKIYTEGKKDPSTVREHADTALKYDSTNPYLYYYLAKSYEKTADKRALPAYREAVKYAPTWLLALSTYADMLKKANRPQDAATLLQAAVQIEKKNSTVILSILDLQWQKSRKGDLTATKQLLNVTEQILAKSPDVPAILAMHIDSLMRLDRQVDAEKYLNNLINAEKPINEQAYLRLAGLADEWNLQQSAKLYELCQQHYGMSPILASSLSNRLIAEGKAEEAGTLLKGMVAKFPEDIRWKLLYAQFLDKVDAPETVDYWRQLVKDYPKNLAILHNSLRVNALKNDYSFVEMVLEKIKEKDGDQSTLWKSAMAQFLLREGEGKKADFNRALNLSTEITQVAPTDPQAWLIRALAYQGLGNNASAVESMERAYRLTPTSLDLGVTLAQMYLKKDDRSNAKNLLDNLARNQSLSPSQKAKVAAMYHTLGEGAIATSLLESIGTPTIMQAVLYRRQGRLEDAVKIYQELLKKPTVQIVQNYADFLGSIGRVADGEKVLNNLKKVPNLSKVYFQLTLAEYYRKYSPNQSNDAFDEAAKIDPTSEQVWKLMVLNYIKSGEIELAIDASRRALQALPGNKLFNIITTQSELIKSAGKLRVVHPVIEALVEYSNYDALVIQILQNVNQMITREQTAQAVGASLRDLANKNPRFLPLQMLTVSWLVSISDISNANLIASRAMDLFPNSEEPAKLAVQVNIKQKKYDEALRMAQEWSKRSQENPIQSDVAIANLYLLIDKPEETLKQIDKYITQLLSNPDAAPAIAMVYFQALIATNQAERAKTILKPLISRSALWRSWWIRASWQYIKDEKSSIEWLDRVKPTIPAEDTRSWLEYTNAYRQLAEKTGKKEYNKVSHDILLTMAKDIKAPHQVLITLAMLEYDNGQLTEAEKYYRRVLGSDEENIIALNNLAVLLTEIPNGNKDEALTLIQKAVKQYPNNANYQDTLSIVYLARKEYDKAVEALKFAVDLQPAKLEWQINLAWAYHKNGNSTEAERLLRRVQLNAAQIDELSDKMKKRLDELKAAVASQASAPSS